MNLYEINSAFEEALLNAMLSAEENDGVIADEISEQLESLELELNEKIENTACYIKNIEAQADAIKAEEKKLADRRKVLENRSENIREWLQTNLKGEKFSTAKVAISFRNTESVIVSSVDDIPEMYQRVKTTKEADKIALKQALKLGETINGASLINKQSMTIK